MTGTPVKDVGSLLNFTGSRKAGASVRSTGTGEFENAMSKASYGDKDSFSESRVSGEKIKTGESNDFQKEKVNQSHPRKDALKREEKNSEVKPEEPGLDTQRQQKVTDAGNEVISEVAQALDISEEEVLDAMEELGLSISAILDPDQLTKLVVSLSGETDNLSLLTDEGLYGKVQNLLQSLEGIRQNLSEEFSVDPEELDQMLAKLKEVPGEEISVADKEAQPEEMPAENGKTEKISITVTDDNRSVKLTTDEKGNTIRAEAVYQKKTEEGDSSSGKEDHAQAGKDGQNPESESPLLTSLQKDQPQNAEVTFEQVTSSDFRSSQEIMDQILDYMKIQLKPEMDQLEMQLHPASLGTLKIHLVSKGGEVTAQFQVQNETVKAAVESQITLLKDSLKEQGIKVEAVEVTVESHAFESNLWQGQERENGSSYQGNKKSPRRINLNALEEGFEEEASDEELLSAQMMKANGGTVDFTA